MPNVKSAAKQARASKRKYTRNQSIKSRIRSGLTRFQTLAKEDPQTAREQAKQVVSWLDRAAKSNVMHRNTARRFKARVMSQLQALAKK